MGFTKITLHSDSLDVKFVIVPGAWASVLTGTKVKNVTSDAPAACKDVMDASVGGVSIAQAGDTYSDDRPFSFLQTLKIERINGSPRHFQVTETFEDPTFGAASLDDLFALPAKISSTGSQDTEEYIKDCSTTPKIVTNTANEPFDRPPTRLSGNIQITIEKFITQSQKASIAGLRKTVNSGGMTIDGFAYPADSLLLTNASFDPVDEAQTVFKATISIEYKPDLWTEDIANVGFVEISPLDGLSHKILEKTEDDKYAPTDSPWPLNMDGSAKDNRSDTIEFLHFVPYTRASWSGLPLT